jgi:hypothetical protein
MKYMLITTLALLLLGCYDPDDDLSFDEVNKKSLECKRKGGTPLKLGIQDHIVPDHQVGRYGEYQYVFKVKCIHKNDGI